MSRSKSNPPQVANWLLRFARPRREGDALTGDLTEVFNEGRTRAWFWRQVLAALAVRLLCEIQRHWPELCYAIAGTAMPAFLLGALRQVPVVLHWWALSWPWSQIVFEFAATGILALAALPILGAGLVINGRFQWRSLRRTAAANIGLLLIGKFLFDAFLPLLTRPMPGNPYARQLLIPGVLMALPFFVFLASSLIGCRQTQRFRSAAKIV